jgi:hypothetical protein
MKFDEKRRMKWYNSYLDITRGIATFPTGTHVTIRALKHRSRGVLCSLLMGLR